MGDIYCVCVCVAVEGGCRERSSLFIFEGLGK